MRVPAYTARIHIVSPRVIGIRKMGEEEDDNDDVIDDCF